MKQASVLIFLFFFFLIFPNLYAINESRSENDVKRLDEVSDDFWAFLVNESEYSLYFRQKLGLDITSLPDLTFEKAERDIRSASTLLSKIDRIKSGSLSHTQQLTLGILRWELRNMVLGHRFFWINIPISADSSLVPDVNRAYSEFSFDKKSQLAEYLDLLNLYPAFITELFNKLKTQSLRNIILPRDAIQHPLSYLESLASEPNNSLFFVKASRLDRIPVEQEEITDFQARVSDLINTRINPSLQAMVRFIKDDYIRKAPEQVGLWQYPGGHDYYRFLVRYHTSQNMSPEMVHQTGLKMINKLRSELDELRCQLKFKGNVDEFIHFIKNDPQFKLESAEEMGRRMTECNAQAKAELPRFFSKVPKAPCLIKRLDPSLEAFMTYGYYQVPISTDSAGIYFFNASNVQHKNRLNTASAALILHELLPGHHLQISLQSENPSLPPFRREYFLSAYAEGWAEYASHLGHEMQLYRDPYEHLGRIMQDLFMSVRLVVDTGMNDLRWSRQKAMEFIKKHTLLSDFELETETLRYACGTPAQALAYKIGGLKMWELRQKAEKTLGKKFDLRWFHNAILDSGTLPLFLLEEHIDYLIEIKARE